MSDETETTVEGSDTYLLECAKKLNAVMGEVSDSLIERTEVVDALKLCVLSGRHLIMEGQHGLAKSMVAHEFFRRISGEATLFDLQFLKSTPADEVFGPMDARLYREKAIYRHNTAGMLPEAHFALLDEVYRASDSLLPSLLRILNEGYFMNGQERMECPLITAIGTCNFTTESTELDAVHDRWMVQIKVKPVSNISNLIQKSLYRSEVNATISIREINALVRRLQLWRSFPEDALLLYADLIEAYRSQLPSQFYLSDRRIGQALSLAKASIMLDGINEAEDDKDLLDPERIAKSDMGFLASTAFALVQRGDPSQAAAFSSAFDKVVGEYDRYRQELTILNKLERVLNKQRDEYDQSMPAKEKEKRLGIVQSLLDGMNAAGPDTLPSSSKGRARWSEILASLESLKITLTTE